MRCLIVGQGIAGTVLAWTLLQRRVFVHIADASFPFSSSVIAAGVINPVTGRRFVKSWRFDEFYTQAKAVYQSIQRDWSVPLWFDQNILRLLTSAQEANDWSARLSSPGYFEILDDRVDPGPWAALLAPGFSFGLIKKSARIDFPALLQQFRAYTQSQGIFIQKKISPEDAVALSGNYDCIVFCEGYRASENPFFPSLPWQISKGEAVLIKLDHPNAAEVQHMLKKTLMLVPLGNGLFWTGSSYTWEFEDTGATEPVQQALETQLATMLQAPYKVVQRMAAIRPTVKDRRPFLGQSPEHSKFYIFNGLGTKGGLLAPYWANALAAHILDGRPLDPEVDIRRFS